MPVCREVKQHTAGAALLRAGSVNHFASGKPPTSAPPQCPRAVPALGDWGDNGQSVYLPPHEVSRQGNRAQPAMEADN